MNESPRRPAGDAIGLMLRSAGRRRGPPQETVEAVYLSTLLAWQAAVRRRRLRQAWALAAALALAASGIGWWTLQLRPPGSAGPVAATVVRAAGSDLRLQAGAPVTVGRELGVPADGSLELRTTDRYILRVAGPARLRFVAARRLHLDRGRIYFSDGAADAAPSGSFSIETDLARVLHVGTQFAVLAESGSLLVRVREGAVRIAAPGAHARIERGFEARLGADSGGRIEQHPIATSGPLWAWADRLLPALDVEGRSLADVLEQIARDSGRRLEYAGETVRSLCRGTLLHGPALDLPPEERLAAVLASTELEAVAEGARIVIRLRPDAAGGPEARW